MAFDPIGAVAARIYAGVAIAAGLALAVQTARIEGLPLIGGGLKAALADAHDDLRAERKAHRLTIDAYRTAQANAARAEQLRIANVRRQQQEISDHAMQDYTRALADLRARYERLRRGFAAGAAGAPGAEPMPGLSDAARGADAAPGGDGFSLERRLIASEQALQLDALIAWVAAQARVDVNSEETPDAR